VANAYDLKYSGGRQEKDCSWKPTQIVHENLIWKSFTKRADGVAQVVGPELKPNYGKKKKKNLNDVFRVYCYYVNICVILLHHNLQFLFKIKFYSLHLSLIIV
jgi:hypothetical protein